MSINGRKVVIRCCRDLRMISALDPEKALLPLGNPLQASEEQSLVWGGQKTLKMTATLQRAVWISGTAAYVDVSIINNTARRVRKLKVKLLRNIVAYKTVSDSILHTKCWWLIATRVLPLQIRHLQRTCEPQVGSNEKQSPTRN